MNKKKYQDKSRQFKTRYNKNCLNCKIDFVAIKSDTKYCSSSCRYQATSARYTESQKQRKQTYQKKWGLKNWLRRRNYMIFYTYGITPEQYQELLQRQDFCCFICQRHETEFARKLAVDHNHQTGEIYGLLCNMCNKDVIGKRRDPELFYNAAKYLEKCRTGWFVPAKNKKRRRKKRKCLKH